VPLPVSGLNASSEMISEDRGDAIPAIRSSTSCAMAIRSSAAFALISPTASVCEALQLGATWISALQRDHAPSHVGVADAFHSGEDMRADRTIDILDRDGTLQDGLKGLPDAEALGLAAKAR